MRGTLPGFMLLALAGGACAATDAAERRAAAAYAECAAFYTIASDYGGPSRQAENAALARVDAANAATLSDREYARAQIEAALPRIIAELKHDKSALTKYQERCDREVPRDHESLVIKRRRETREFEEK
jgi:hypothetical protein